MIAQGITFVANKTWVIYRRNSCYDGNRLSRDTKCSVWSPLWVALLLYWVHSQVFKLLQNPLSIWKIKLLVIIIAYRITFRVSNYLYKSSSFNNLFKAVCLKGGYDI